MQCRKRTVDKVGSQKVRSKSNLQTKVGEILSLQSPGKAVEQVQSVVKLRKHKEEYIWNRTIEKRL